MNLVIHPFDERRNLAIPGDAKATLLFCLNHFISAAKESIAKKGAFRVALSGGSTPKALFKLLTKPPYVNQIDWHLVHLFWSDERSVLPTDPDSNYHMAMESGFADVGIPPSQIHRMECEVDIQKGADSYEKLLRIELQGGGFDYLCLGMGEDGHTASLFPHTKGLGSTGRLVIANEVPQKNTYRMTLTFDCINAAQHIVLYVLGENKKEMVQTVFSSQENLYPVQRVGTTHHKALWILDQQAASFLNFGQ